MRKKRFFVHKRSKLMLRRDRTFQILERINNNAYKVDIPDEYGVVLLLMFMISLCLMQEMI